MNFFTHCPKDSIFEELVKFRFIPHSFIMPRSSIKNPPFSLLTNPSPWFRILMRITRQRIPHHQHSPVLRIVPLMKISFIPCLQVTDPLNGGMIDFYNSRAEDSTLVTLETASDKLVILGDIGKAPARTVNRNKSLSRTNKRQ